MHYLIFSQLYVLLYGMTLRPPSFVIPPFLLRYAPGRPVVAFQGQGNYFCIDVSEHFPLFFKFLNAATSLLKVTIELGRSFREYFFHNTLE
jgi:hypothetical protein